MLKTLGLLCKSRLKQLNFGVCRLGDFNGKANLLMWLHPKLHNINLHNVTHSLISRNLREQMFVVQISLLIVTFLFLILHTLSLMQTTKKSTHTLALRHVSICGVSPSYSDSSSSYVTCWMLVHAYATLPGKAKWSGPHHIIKMLHFVLFHSVRCYTNSIVSCIHVNTTKLRNITCTLVATCVILHTLECILEWIRGATLSPIIYDPAMQT
jgi:hypothetical protein